MAEFTVSGERGGERVSVTWRDGEVSSTDAASKATADWITRLATMLDGTLQGLPGLPKTVTDHLKSPYTAYALMRSVFAGKTTLDRPLPKLDVPPGVVI